MTRINPTLFVFLAIAALATALPAQDEHIIIRDPARFLGLTPPEPISITGFSEETERVLVFDLTVMGFINVPPEAAKYALTGTPGENVQGQLSLGGSGAKSVLFSRVYSGPSLRAQAHRLADDVVLQLTGVNGIAETRIAFKVEGRGGSEVYVSDFDGFDAQPVTSDHSIVAAPCWVPGHLAMYYTSYKLGNDNIFFQNLATGERRNFAHYAGMNSSAAVSPDGSLVAMILSKTGRPDVYVCGADGNGLKQLTDTRDFDSCPCWTADGRWVCYAGKIDGRRGLYKVSVEGGEPQRIATSGVLNPTEPDFSPDGKWLTFTCQMGGFSICVAPAGGGHATVLVAGEDPSWAPNSRTLIFVRTTAGGNKVLSLLDVPTKQVKDVSRVSGSNSSNSQPSWAR